ncbi:inositol 2-dehydrogenase [Balneatrix alpica]|uniref:inositol 2-dehydrogenase n=1 Tax=Balneatrix alpica TaxID=75684 RepID=UPI002738EA5F|nr:inositol 2-dehydrogenase [Balneatrix alpica]
MLEFCLFGAGRIGAIHAANVAAHPQARIRYVVDVNQQAAATLASQLGARTASVEQALADPAVNAVIIASSTNTHAELMIAAAQAGKAIFCEKPIDLDIAQARACAEVVKAAGVLCSLGFNRRYDPSFRSLHNRIQQGQIGHLEQVIITSRDPSPPPVSYIQVSGGLFRDMMIHDLDMARWLLGEEPVEVYASASCLVDPAIAQAGDVDSAMVILKTASGRLCHINNSRRACYGYDQRLEAFGSQGMLQAGNHHPSSVSFSGEAGVVGDKPLHFFLERYADAYRIELQDFVDAVVEGKTPYTGIQDGVRALELADACLASYQSGQRVRLS